MQMAAAQCRAPFVGSAIARNRGERTVAAQPSLHHNDGFQKRSVNVLLSLATSAALALSAGPAAADISNIRLPPLDNDPDRCERGFVGNTIGQANAVSNKPLDLRFCKYHGANLSGKTLSGAYMSDTDFSGANMQEAVLTKAYAVGANMQGTDLTNAVVDRVVLDNANLENAKLVNAVITGTTFKGANLKGADFEDALIGSEDAKRLCANPTLVGESRIQVGCRQ